MVRSCADELTDVFDQCFSRISKKVDVLPILRMIADRLIASLELHIALPLAGVVENAGVPAVAVQRSRPVILTALAAVLAFIPLTFSVFWGSMPYTLIGGTAVGTVLTLVFLPALYSIWFGVKPAAVPSDEAQAGAGGIHSRREIRRPVYHDVASA